MKMRVMYSSKKGKVATYAEAIGQACGCLTNDIPPAYPADKERLVIIGVTLKGEPEDKVRRFCSELIPARAQNVALFTVKRIPQAKSSSKKFSEPQAQM